MRFPARFILLAALAAGAPSHEDGGPESCTDEAVRFKVDDPLYSNYFYSDCNSASQVVVTSPLPDSNLTLIGPRLLVCPSHI